MRSVNKNRTVVRGSPDPDAPRQKKVLMAARVSKEFHEWVEAECVRREVSLQKFLTSAVTSYIAASAARGPKEDDDESRPAHLLNLGWVTEEPRNTHEQLWSAYLDKMPDEKIDVMLRAMKWDLQMKKSARRKGQPKRAVGKR